MSSETPGSRPALTWQLVVLNWNGRDDTLNCLASARKIGRADVHVVCVDNGSTDGSVEAIRDFYPEVDLIEAGSNLGYAGGNNLGLRRALERGATWAVLINNDSVVSSDVIEGFERALSRRPDAGVLAGKVYFADRPSTIWFAGQRVETLLGYSGRPRGYGRSDSPRFQKVGETDRAVGALMAISHDAIERVGLLDEDLFAYVEDVDFSLRARRAGFKIVFAPEARAWHRVSGSTGGEAASTHTLYYGARNSVIVFERERPLGVAGTWLRRSVIGWSFAVYALSRADRRAALHAVVDGLRDAFSGRLGPRPANAGQRAAARS
jgi:GT2 family glycosyltransferase